jgi:hypothetical protein
MNAPAITTPTEIIRQCDDLIADVIAFLLDDDTDDTARDDAQAQPDEAQPSGATA